MSIIGRICLFKNVNKCAAIGRVSQFRCISTSKKNRDTATVEAPVAGSASDQVCESTSKNWISYGFSTTNEKEDLDGMHSLMFFGVTITFICGGYLLAYRPDELGRSWAQREGFLELRRREQLGLPRVDPNYVSLSKIKLPSDDELGDTEIII